MGIRKNIAISLIFMCFGLLIGHQYSSNYERHIESKESEIRVYHKKTVSLQGEILDTQKRDTHDITYVVKVMKINEKDVTFHTKIHARIPQNFDLSPGHYLTLQGRFSLIEDFDPYFSYQNFLRAR